MEKSLHNYHFPCPPHNFFLLNAEPIIADSIRRKMTQCDMLHLPVYQLPVNNIIRSRRVTIDIKKHIITKLIPEIHPLKLISDLRKGTE